MERLESTPVMRKRLPARNPIVGLRSRGSGREFWHEASLDTGTRPGRHSGPPCAARHRRRGTMPARVFGTAFVRSAVRNVFAFLRASDDPELEEEFRKVYQEPNLRF